MRSLGARLLLLFARRAARKKEAEPQPVVTVQTAPVERGTIQQIITRRSHPVSARSGGHHSQSRRAGEDVLRESRQPRCIADNCSQCWRTAIWPPPKSRTRARYEQAQATYGLETTSALPEEWQKAELDLKTAKEAYDAEQKVYDSRRVLFQQGAMPRKELDASAVSLVQAKAQYDIAEKHLAALQSAGKQQQLKSAKGQLTSAQGKYEGAAAQLAYTEIRSPIDGVVTDRPTLSGRDAGARHAAAHRHGHFLGDRARAYSAERGRRAEAGRCRDHQRSRRRPRQRQSDAGQSGARSQQHHGGSLGRGRQSRWTAASGHGGHGRDGCANR